VDFDVRGSLLIAVMIHVIQIASTRDYHSEVDTLVTKQNTFQRKEYMIVSQTACSGVTSQPYVMI